MVVYLLRCVNTRKYIHLFFCQNGKPRQRLFCSTRKTADEASEENFRLENADIPGAHTLYPEHIETSALQKFLLAVGSAAIAIADPYRDDMVAVMGETTGTLALHKINAKMRADPEGLEILRDKPRINSNTVKIDHLKSLPEGTLGHYYFRFLMDNGVSPDTRRPVHFVDDANLAYVMQRYREVHDLIHTVLGMPTNMLGEVAVKWIEAIQTGLPMCTAGALFGPVRFKTQQRKKYLETYLPWAINCGSQAKFLMNVYYEKRWEQPMESLREELNIITPPTGL